jgi:hypothetical protein
VRGARGIAGRLLRLALAPGEPTLGEAPTALVQSITAEISASLRG